MMVRPKLVPTLFTVPALIALVALGVWQLERLAWKETLIDRLQSRATMEPVPLPAGDLAEAEWDYRRVRATGVFDHADEIHLLNRSLNGNPGLHVLTPLRRTDVPGDETILVNRGWVPFERKAPSTREAGQVDGEVTVEGILRFPAEVTALQRVFLPENEPGNNMWYSADTEQIARHLGRDLPGYYLVDGRTDTPGTYPVGRQWRLDVRNNHLEYALTWFALALGLAVIYVVYHRRPRRDGAEPEDGGAGGTRS